MSRIKKVCPWE